MGIRRRIWREMDEGSSEGGMNVEYTDKQHEVKNREDKLGTRRGRGSMRRG
jgi:hypothetical protein